MRIPISIPAPSNQRKGSLHARLVACMAVIFLFLAACSGAATPIPSQGPAPSVAPAESSIPSPIPTPISTASPAPIPTLVPTPPSTLAPTASPAPSVPPASASPSQAPATGFPVTITDDEGTPVTIAAEPQRIVSLSPSNTEIVFALGAGDRLVGGTDSDDYPAQAAALPHVVQQGKVLHEQIAALDADLVITNGNGLTAPADIQKLRDDGLPVIVLTAQSVAAVEADITLLGKAIGDDAEATQIVSGMQSQIARISAEAAAVADHPRTFYEVYYDPTSSAPLFGIAKDSAYEDLIKLAGGDPITTGDSVSYAMPLEALVAADPQVILLGDAMYGTCPADVAKRDGWKKITAVKTGAVRSVFDTVITRPGPRMVQGLASLVRGIHPELTIPYEPADPPMCGAP